MNYVEYKKMSPSQKFDYFMNTRISTNRTPKYWVNWQNVIQNTTEQMKIALNTLNYLVKADNIKEKARILFTRQINLVKLIPILIASRDNNIDVLQLNKNGKLSTYNVDFENPKVENINKYISFMDECGLLDFLQNYINTSLIDYVYGVQTGLDSNGRKNRSGIQNEEILEFNLSNLIDINENIEYKTQATAKYIKKRWGIIVPENLSGKNVKGGRRYDGAVYNKKNDKITIIETNFYSGGGSKLKSVSGEFSDMYSRNLSNSKKINFVWISDGKGWDTAKNPLREAFDVIPNIFNLNMVQNGFLNEVVNS